MSKPTQLCHRVGSVDDELGHEGREGLVEPDALPPAIVTRSPNHMWAISWATTSATRSISARAAVRVDQQGRLAEDDAAEVLHGAGGEVGHGDEVELVAGVGNREVVGEELDRVDRHVECRPGEAAPCPRVHDPQREHRARHGLGRLQVADHERHEVRRHFMVGAEANDVRDRRATRSSPHGEFDTAARSAATVIVTSNVAFMRGLVEAREAATSVGGGELRRGDVVTPSAST